MCVKGPEGYRQGRGVETQAERTYSNNIPPGRPLAEQLIYGL